MNSPFPTIFIASAYIIIVKYGPHIMKDRKAFEMRWFLVLYNFGVTFLNGWMAIEVSIINI
jgi:elongation of very long chain fatty acids protein 4